MPTIYDIAQKTGFSITTVSKVLNNYPDVGQKTRKKILETVEEMGYYPSSHARTLTTKKSWTIGVIFMESLGVGFKHPFFNSVMQAFKQVVELKGYDLLFIASKVGDEKKSYYDHFQYRGVDGVVIICSNNDEEEVDKLVNSKIPTVIIDLNNDKTSTVYSENANGSILAFDYLYSLGHRKIAHIAGHQQTFAGTERINGFLKAAKLKNVDVPATYIVNGGYFSIEGGREAMKQLLALSNPPTAVVAASDTMAFGAMQVCIEKGIKVPEDISFVGFDDIEWSQYVTPSLTTIKQDTDLIGIKAAELLLKQIDPKKKLRETEKVPVKLVERNSCRRIK